MIYIYYVILFAIIFLCVNSLLRYFYYREIKKNFLDLAKSFQGLVQQNQIFAYPIFNGIIQDKKFKITISEDKLDNKKVIYLAISAAFNTKFKLTILSKKWLTRMNEKNDNDIFFDDTFIYRTNSKSDANFFLINQANKQKLIEFLPFSYLVINKDSILIEVLPDNLSKYLKKDVFKSQLLKLFSFLEALK